MKETQESIYRWATETFGETTLRSTILRAQEEFDELYREINVLTDSEYGQPASFNNHHDYRVFVKKRATVLSDIITEIADVVIILTRLAEMARRLVDRPLLTLDQAIDDKMAINRKREWIKDGHGHGKHVGNVEHVKNMEQIKKRERENQEEEMLEQKREYFGVVRDAVAMQQMPPPKLPGFSTTPGIDALRERQRRNLLCVQACEKIPTAALENNNIITQMIEVIERTRGFLTDSYSYRPDGGDYKRDKELLLSAINLIQSKLTESKS